MAEITEGPAVPFPIANGDIGGTGPGSYCGFTMRESGTPGAAALVTIMDGAGGPILEEITLTAGQSTSDHYPRPGRSVRNLIHAVITGAVTGSVFQ